MSNRSVQAVKRFLKRSRTGRLLLVPYRLKLALSYYYRPLVSILPWCVRSREFTNFTYDLDPLNKAYLASFIVAVTGCDLQTIQGYLDEIERDERLRTHVATLTQASDERTVADREVRFGRRIGWYAFVRALKPRLVVETGVDKGLGSCVLAAALMKNAADGFEGRHVGIDINPAAGYLLRDPYDKYGTVLHGDSVAALSRIAEPIDLFIQDSDHSADYEMREYETIRAKLASAAVLLGDNAHGTRQLFDFAANTGRNFLFFKEQPKDHWYPGGGIGAAFPKR